MNIYSPSLARNILHKTSRSRLHRSYSHSSPVLAPRPYTFHIGASWAGKHDDNPKKVKAAFPPDTLIGTWRDKTLSRPKAVRSQDAGEDFFFVQEVLYIKIYITRLLTLILDAESISKLSTASVQLKASSSN